MFLLNLEWLKLHRFEHCDCVLDLIYPHNMWHCFFLFACFYSYRAGIYLSNISDGNSRRMSEICPKLIVNALDRLMDIIDVVLVSLMWTLSRFCNCSGILVFDSEEVKFGGVTCKCQNAIFFSGISFSRISCISRLKL